jgi:hypothetical protein
MGLFEQNPLLIVPLVLAVVVAYDAVKWVARSVIQGYRSQQITKLH